MRYDRAVTGGDPTAALWRSMLALLGHVDSAPDRATLLDVCLDTVVAELGADRGIVVLSEAGQAPYIVNARADGRALAPAEREEISRSVIRDVLERGASITWQADVAEDGPAPASMRALGIVLAAAEPITWPGWRRRGRGAARGVLYLDFRSPRRALQAAPHRPLVAAAARLISILLDPLEEVALGQERERALAARPPQPALAELLASRSLLPLKREVESLVASEAPLLVLGESGTGKTLLATAIAEASGRLPVVRAMLGASDDLNTITSELFGHERGAFSGALARRRGLVDFADGGTLILDELLNLPLLAQRLLLDFTQFGTYRPLGHEGAEPRRARVRLIAVTNGDLEGAVRAGRFREDLFYRLAGARLEVPPLRERRGDIPALAEATLAKAGAPPLHLDLEARRLLLSPTLALPGNVRQLESAVLRARDRALAEARALGREADAVGAQHFAPGDLGVGALPPAGPAQPEVEEAAAPAGGDIGGRYHELLAARGRMDGVEATLLREALDRHGGVIAHAARALGVPRTSLASRLSALGITRTARTRP